MLILHVFIQVKSKKIDRFIETTLANATASRKEPGIIKFDVFQEKDRPEHFLLVEVYRTKDDPARHKETEHYKLWKETVSDMMAVPRTKKVYDLISPGEEQWM